jgi:hypothetical protein
MAELRQRRSPRIALQTPIRVFGRDTAGNSFYEDSTTLVVNEGGARILLSRKPDPSRDLFILCHKTDLGERFRVVGHRGRFEPSHESWAVESINGSKDIWGVDFPTAQTEDLQAVRVMLACTDCHTQQQLFLNESQVQWLCQVGSTRRDCAVCHGLRLCVLAPCAEEALCAQ